jgi:hypothetical protein
MAEKGSNNTDAQPYVHHLVWLDKDVENDLNQRKLNRLREFDEKIKTFTSRGQCLDYLQEQDDRNSKSYIILIISGSLSEKIVPKVLDCVCILEIFVFCTKSEQVGPFKSNMVTICTNTDELINRIHSCITRDQSSIDYSLLDIQDTSKFNPIIISVDILFYL